MKQNLRVFEFATALRKPSLILGMAIALTLGCHSVPATAAESMPALTKVTMSRTYCYGGCPAYTITVWSDGCAKLVGVSNFILIGEYWAPDFDFDRLRDEIESRDFFSLSGTYPKKGVVLDAPLLTVAVERGGKTYTVSAWGEENGPATLADVADIFDGLAFRSMWVNERTGNYVSTFAPNWSTATPSAGHSPTVSLDCSTHGRSN